MPEGVKELIIFNKEYKKTICIGRGCGKTIEVWRLEHHLRNKHKVGIAVSREATRLARELGWEERERLRANIPYDGSAPQVGIAVKDGFQCRYCGQYVSTAQEGIQVHWNHVGHGPWKECGAEKVRYQSWDGSYDNGYWLVGDGRKENPGVDLGAGLVTGDEKNECEEADLKEVEDWVVV